MSKSSILKAVLTFCVLVSVSAAAFAQNSSQPLSSGASREVKGTVFDGSEQPLMGVAVVIAGTSQGGGNRS